MLKWFMVFLLFCLVVSISVPARPAAIETWIIGPDGRTASVTGRVSQPIWKKLNPVWWFLNDDEPDPPDWQLPGKPFIIRQLSWYLRNPLHNFGKYVLGVVDRNYKRPPSFAENSGPQVLSGRAVTRRFLQIVRVTTREVNAKRADLPYSQRSTFVIRKIQN